MTQPSGDAIPWGTGRLSVSNTALGDSARDSATSSCDAANLPHFEQINIQDLHSKPADDNEDDDTSSSRSHHSDESSDDDQYSSGSAADGEGDQNRSRSSGGGSDNKPKSYGNVDTDNSGRLGNANTSSASHAKNIASADEPMKTISKPKSKGSSTAPHFTNAVVGTPPTPALPLLQKHARSTSTSATSGTKATPVTPATHSEASPGACQCSSDRVGNLKLVNEERRKETASLWLLAYPWLLVLVLVY
jgi:hypothetical protein